MDGDGAWPRTVKGWGVARFMFRGRPFRQGDVLKMTVAASKVTGQYAFELGVATAKFNVENAVGTKRYRSRYGLANGSVLTGDALSFDGEEYNKAAALPKSTTGQVVLTHCGPEEGLKVTVDGRQVKWPHKLKLAKHEVFLFLGIDSVSPITELEYTTEGPEHIKVDSSAGAALDEVERDMITLDTDNIKQVPGGLLSNAWVPALLAVALAVGLYTMNGPPVM